MPPKKAKAAVTADITDEIAEMKAKLLNKLSDKGADLDEYKKKLGLHTCFAQLEVNFLCLCNLHLQLRFLCAECVRACVCARVRARASVCVLCIY